MRSNELIESAIESADVTVGILSFNTPETQLRHTVDSVKKTSPASIIILACNNPDPAAQKANQALAEALDIRFLGSLPNRGFGAGHNRILATVQTKYYVCCNPDVIIFPGCIQSLRAKAEGATDSGLLAPKILNPDKSIQKLARKHLTVFNWITRQLARFFKIPTYESKFDYDRPQVVEFVSGCFFLAEAEKLLNYQGFDESFFMYCEDADLSRRISASFKNYYVPEAVIIHEWHKGWTKSVKTFQLHLRSLVRFFMKHGFLG
jgi:GT2 family glycosyltransferase